MSIRRFIAGVLCAQGVYAQDIPGPPGSSQFGKIVAVLPNGNFVVTDPFYDPPGTPSSVGAVYLFRNNRVLISQLTGTKTGDNVARQGIVILPSGNFVVLSTEWDNGTVVDAGAVTFINGSIGLSGEISPANSLVGSSMDDEVGSNGVDVLSNGNYVVVSSRWNRGTVVDVGAVTWAQGTTGISGVVSLQNSLVGASLNDTVGNFGNNSAINGVIPLTNGNYVVSATLWDNGNIADVGAVTWVDGSIGIAGEVGVENSLVGVSAGDVIGGPEGGGEGRPVALSNGNYVVSSPAWNNGPVSNAGAATWCRGTGPTMGIVSTANSLVGSNTNDRVGEPIVPLTNGNYLVASRQWDAPGFTNAGALSWRDGTAVFPGIVSLANSLVGVRSDHQVGSGTVVALTNGNFAFRVSGISAADSAASTGAVIWGDGTVGLSGPVSAAIGLAGSSPNDLVGSGIFALASGHYVVTSHNWANGGFLNAGAVTWRNGAGPSSATVSPSNSLVGTKSNDQVGNFGVTPLSNGNYVVKSGYWNSATVTFLGAVTLADGAGGTVGVVSPSNSLVGTSFNDRVGEGSSVVELDDCSYVVLSPSWTNAGAAGAGAVTWSSGISGATGTINGSNSLVGTMANDRVGNFYAHALPGGRYFVVSSQWNEAAPTAISGAETLGAAVGITVGPITASNSVLESISDVTRTGSPWDQVHERFAVWTGIAILFVSYETMSFDGFE